MLAERVKNISASTTLGLNAKAKELAAKGIDVVNLAAGEPDFDTPENIKKAAIDAIKSGFTKYTAVAGIPELREAIAGKLKAENGLDYRPEQIVVSCGGKQSLYNAFQAICNPGDEVIVPKPYWVTYSEQIKLCGARPVFVETGEKENFRLFASKVEKAITGRTRVILINSPNNPTGAVYDRDELRKIARIAVENNVFVISDEIYEHLVYEGEHVSIASFGDEIKERAIVSNGASKSYSMTGWRIGWAAGPLEIMKGIGNFQSHTTSNPASMCQKAYLAALAGPQDSVRTMVKEFRKRRDFIVKRLNEIEGISCTKPQGAFYVFPNVSATFSDKMKNSMDFSMQLLEKAKVVVVPGLDFGGEGHVRISYACSMECIEKGMDRIEEFLRSAKR